MNKGEYSAVLENISLKNIPNDTLKQLKELGYILTEYKTLYYMDSIDNVKISW